MMQGLSRNMRRVTRRARRKRATELNIVSMIDILTVLVFFLLVNALGVSILGINLPSSDSPPPDKPLKNLRVIVRQDGLTVGDEAGVLKQFPLAAGSYDFKGLGELMAQVKDREPAEDKISLLLEPGIQYDVLVQVMDAVRLQAGTPGHPQRDLFPQIAVGDAPNPGTGPGIGPAPAAPGGAAPAGGAKP
ncbi:MAG: biopolymer transporter ExbD [Nevskia sp.]|nr:biopolymer transporter ExbD [Nevskia sp.]